MSRRRQSIQLIIQAAFQELTQNQLMIQVDSPGIDSDRLTTQSASPFFDSNQLILKRKLFDSESTHHSTPSPRYPCLPLGPQSKGRLKMEGCILCPLFPDHMYFSSGWGENFIAGRLGAVRTNCHVSRGSVS